MARGVLTVYSPAVTGTALTYTAADAVNGHEFANTAKEYLLVRNDDVAGTDITFITYQVVESDLSVADRTVTVAAGTEVIIGTFSKGIYNDTAGNVEVDVSNATSVTLCVIQQ